MRETYQVQKEDFANAGKVSSHIKTTLKQLGVEPALLRRIAIAVYEAEINMVIHSDGGAITMEIDEGSIRFTFADQGPGIADIEAAMQPGYSTANEAAREFGFGAGMGLPNIQRNSDSFDIQSSPAGTILNLSYEVNP
ncbi:MAG: ATP-binding protein [Erysipelotrichaceae bacterium]|jgi:anti-sigma regulatory factor (Ser/Thr protein kinase)|nr:ATP-binding protein [Erysipelotrichaceae bacterium]